MGPSPSTAVHAIKVASSNHALNLFMFSLWLDFHVNTPSSYTRIYNEGTPMGISLTDRTLQSAVKQNACFGLLPSNFGLQGTLSQGMIHAAGFPTRYA